MSLAFTRHALERIRKGDENGLRTVLAPDEIEEILSSDTTVPFGGGYLFYSPKDGKCLFAAMGHYDKDTVVSIVPATRVDLWKRLLAERKATGEDFFVKELPPVTSMGRANAALVGGVIEMRFESRWWFDREAPFFSWLDFRENQAVLLRSRNFHKTIIMSLEDYRQRIPRSHYRIAEVFVRGIGWKHHFPISMPYDFLGKEPQI